MSSIFGIINKNENHIDQSVIDRGMKLLGNWNPDYSNTWSKNNVGLGAHLFYSNMKSTLEDQPYYDIKSGCCIVFDGRIDYEEDLANDLGEGWSQNEAIPDSRLILKAYLKFGFECVNYLYGDFAFAIWDSTKGNLYCSRDHFGCRPLYYFDSPELFIFSSSLEAIVALSGFSEEIREEYIVRSISGIPHEKDKTAFHSIYRLMPAHFLIVNDRFEIHTSKYWDIDVNKKATDVTVEQAISGLRRRFYNAVYERCKNSSSIGVELSGGLDSSAVTAIAFQISKVLKSDLFTYTNSLHDSQKDNYPFEDMSWIVSLLTDRYFIEKNNLITGDENVGLLQSIEEGLLTYFRPISHGMGSMSYQLYKRVRADGNKVLLSGFGGDECVSSNASGYFHELVYSWKIDTLVNELKSYTKQYGGNWFLSLIRVMITSWIPFIKRANELLNSSKLWKSRYNSLPISIDLRKKYGIKKWYRTEKRSSIEHSLRNRQYRRILHRYVSERLEESYLSAQHQKIEYGYPFLDVKLIEFYFTLPSDIKFRNGFGRWAFRKAMDKDLPHEICWKKRKLDPVIPYAHYLFLNDISKIQSLLEESMHKNNYQYVDLGKLARAVDSFSNWQTGISRRVDSRALVVSLGILILQKWQREGKIDIGIKC